MGVEGEIAIHAETNDFVGEILGKWIETLGDGIGIGGIVNNGSNNSWPYQSGPKEAPHVRGRPSKWVGRGGITNRATGK